MKSYFPLGVGAVVQGRYKVRILTIRKPRDVSKKGVILAVHELLDAGVLPRSSLLIFPASQTNHTSDGDEDVAVYYDIAGSDPRRKMKHSESSSEK